MSAGAAAERPSWFQRFLLPGLALKAVVIGGGYATGRELAEFFLPSGPWGGLAAMLLAMTIWSVVAAVTFLFARTVGARNYRSFFEALLGRGWPLFEIAYLFFIILLLAVFGAAAGAIAESSFGMPSITGTLALMAGICLFATFGNASVEQLFKWVSVLLYVVYALFLVLALAGFGDRIGAGFARAASADGWVLGGLTYASYNIIGAVVILPVLRHITSDRDAVVAGLIAGPLAMAPAIVFFVCMIAYYPGIGHEVLPSDFLLSQLGSPAFHLMFQLMIFAALLESGTGAVHAVNERIAKAWHIRRGAELGNRGRSAITLVVLSGCMLVADRVGLVALIATGYRALAGIFLAVYVLPLMTVGLVRLARRGQAKLEI